MQEDKDTLNEEARVITKTAKLLRQRTPKRPLSLITKELFHDAWPFVVVCAHACLQVLKIEP